MGYVFMRFGADFKPDNVDRLRQKVGECLLLGGIVGSNVYMLTSILDELVCNILEHGHANWLELEMHPDLKHVKLVLRDDGDQFDPGETILHKDIDTLAENEGERSLGLYMVGQMASSWNYRRVDGAVNELNLVVDL